jgi:hypothetical protein
MYGPQRITRVWDKIEAIKNPPLTVFKGIEVNLKADGTFDGELP